MRLIGEKPLTAAERTRRYRLRHPEKCKHTYAEMSDVEKAGARRRTKAYEKRNPDRSRIKGARYRATEYGAASHMYWNAKKRAADDGLAFDLTKEWIFEAVKAGRCQVSGLLFDTSSGRKPWAPSLDKINPKGGYTKDNVQVVVWMYNACKWTFTHDDVLTLARALLAGKKP